MDIKQLYRNRQENNMEKIKILVADDDREIVNAICTLLEEEGYETVKAYNGKEVMQCMHAISGWIDDNIANTQ